MKNRNLIRYLFFPYCLAIGLPTFSQDQYKGITEKGVSAGHKPRITTKAMISLSAGMTSSLGNGLADSALIGSGWNINGSVYFPFINKSGDDSGTGSLNRLSFGILTRLNYTGLKAGKAMQKVENNYRLSGGIIAPQFQSTPSAYSMDISAGPKMVLELNKFYFSPNMLLGYQRIHRSAYSINGNVANPGAPSENKDLSFLSSAKINSSGLVVKPGLDLEYRVASHFSLGLQSQLAFGPTLSGTYSFLQPANGQNDKNTYSYDQYIKSTQGSRTTRTSYKTFSLNLGITYVFEGNQNQSRRAAHKIAKKERPKQNASALETNNIISPVASLPFTGRSILLDPALVNYLNGSDAGKPEELSLMEKRPSAKDNLYIFYPDFISITSEDQVVKDILGTDSSSVAYAFFKSGSGTVFAIPHPVYFRFQVPGTQASIGCDNCNSKASRGVCHYPGGNSKWCDDLAIVTNPQGGTGIKPEISAMLVPVSNGVGGHFMSLSYNTLLKDKVTTVTLTCHVRSMKGLKDKLEYLSLFDHL
ncbi:hypothetical protein ACX0G9_23440 [Flavitalea flava]